MEKLVSFGVMELSRPSSATTNAIMDFRDKIAAINETIFNDGMRKPPMVYLNWLSAEEGRHM